MKAKDLKAFAKLPLWQQEEVQEVALLEEISIKDSSKRILKANKKKAIEKRNNDFFLKHL